MKKSIKNKIYGINQFFAIRQIIDFSISSDGKTIAFITNTSGLPNIWTIPIQGGWASQITIADNAIRGLNYSPTKKELIFFSDNKGDENLQIYKVSDNGGEIDYLTPQHNGFQVYFIDWNKAGDRILYCSNKRDEKYFDTFVLNLITLKEECVYTSDNKYATIPSCWSKDENLIAYTIVYHNANQDIAIYNRKENSFVNITKHNGNAVNEGPYIDKKNKYIHFLSNYEREFKAIARYEIKTKKLSWFILEDWDIIDYSFSKSGKYLLYTVNANGNSKIKLLNLKTNKTKILKLLKGNCLKFGFTPDETKIVLLYDQARNPNDIYVYNIKSDTYRQITFSMIGGIPKEDFIEPKLIKYKSFDGIEISALLYIPKWMKKDGTNPAILWPHGGPEVQMKNEFNKYLQIMANRGFIVIAPNYRGSTGYGKKFQHLIYKDWGGGEFMDLLYSVEYLKQTGYVNPKKIGVVGGSYGGFLTLTCVTKAPEIWRCAVDIFGPANLITFANSIPEHWKPAMVELLGDVEKDKDLFTERSPINFVDNIKCPMCIIQGENDIRVVKSESDQIVEKIQKMNKPVEYLVIEGEGHLFSKISTHIKVWETITNFLDKYMKG
jgi:dipeptidyl aminopeptidase/acylaminoacyl peptidase